MPAWPTAAGSAGSAGPDVRSDRARRLADHAEERLITGVFLGAEMVMMPERITPDRSALLGRVASGELRVVIDRTFPLADAAEAHRYIESRQAFGRVLLIP